MKRRNDPQVAALAARFGGKYVETRFKNGSDEKKKRVVTCVAHGYYVGDRLANSLYTRWLFRPKPPMTDRKLALHGLGALQAYFKAKGIKEDKNPWSEQMLIRASFTVGFEEGFRVRERAVK